MACLFVAPNGIPARHQWIAVRYCKALFFSDHFSRSITTASTNAFLLLHDIRVCTGTVTRTSEVRPELVLGHFSCQDCYTEQDMTEQQFKYTGAIVL